jgi:hypothetical protein
MHFFSLGTTGNYFQFTLDSYKENESITKINLGESDVALSLKQDSYFEG